MGMEARLVRVMLALGALALVVVVLGSERKW